jgi:hypothetical protein
MNQCEYFYIQAWGIAMSWSPDYIKAYVRRAQEEDAPASATWCSADGVWSTIEDVNNEATVAFLEEKAAELRGDFF